MPRRNGRRENYQPIDLTPDDIQIGKRIKHPFEPGEPPEKTRVRRRVEHAHRQREARINRGIDWTICLVPGCGEELAFFGRAIHEDPNKRDHKFGLPLCLDHLCVAYQQACSELQRPLVLEANAALTARKDQQADEAHEAQKEAFRARRDGSIYFVRLNGLVKAGWSRDVESRLRAYGPEVEVLCIYPGTRDDETHLHRQLRPALARGREWYEDGPIIAAFVSQALEKYGPPDVHDSWTRPKDVIRPRKRAS